MRKVRIYGMVIFWKSNRKSLRISFVDIKNPHNRGDIEIDYKDGISEEDIKDAIAREKAIDKDNIEIAKHILPNLPLKES